MYSNTRPGAESGTSEAIDDEDNVELEKSNVLLMGPTGSGNDSTFSLLFQVPMTCCENQCLPHCYFVSPAFKLQILNSGLLF